MTIYIARKEIQVRPGRCPRIRIWSHPVGTAPALVLTSGFLNASLSFGVTINVLAVADDQNSLAVFDEPIK